MESKQTKIGFMFMFLLAVALFVISDVQAEDKIVLGDVDILQKLPTALTNQKGYTFDDKIKFTKPDLKSEIGSKYTIYDSEFLFFQGDLKQENILKENTYSCSNDCMFSQEITITIDTQLIEEIKTYRIIYENDNVTEKSRYEAPIRSLNLYIKGEDTYKTVEDYEIQCKNTGEISKNGTVIQDCFNVLIGTHEEAQETLIPYNYEVLKAGTYTLIGKGEKRADWIYDWITTSQGKEMTSWSIWGVGNITEFKDEVTNTFMGKTNGQGNYTFGLPGKINTAVSLSKTYLNLTTSTSNFMKSNSAFSYSFWVYGNNTNATTYLVTGISKGGCDHSGFQHSLAINSTSVQAHMSKNCVSQQIIDYSANIQGNWNYITFVYYGNTTFSLYLNGAKVGTKTESSLSTATSYDVPLFLGNAWVKNDSMNTIKFDEYSVFNKALSNAEVLSLYNSGNGLAYSSFGDLTTNLVSYFKLDEGEEKSEGTSITLNSPADNLQTTETTINFNATIIPIDATIKNVTLYLNENEYLDLYNTNETINYSKILTLEDGDYTWNITACWIGVSTEENCTESDTRTFRIDATLPNITILSGDETQPYYYSGINHTVNFTVEDDKLDSAWYSYNGTNKSITPLISGNNNSITFSVEKGIYNLTIYANDTFGNVASKEINWSYYVYENNVVYNPTTTEGKIEDFVFSLTTTSEITAAIFNYDGIRSSANIYSAGTNKTISINDYEIPSIETDKNITFFLELTLTGGIKINSTSYIQSVKNLGFDDCSSNTFPLMNMSLYDEKAKTPLTGTIEVNYWIENALFTNKIATYNNTFSSTSSKRICSNVNLSGQGLYQSAIIRYSATGYVPEFYNVQRAEVDGVQYIKLYDLNESDSTEFLVTYYNDNFIKVSGAILQLLRGYIDKDIYEVVEAPLTSSEGTAIVHVDTKTNLYKAILVKDGVILNTFNDLVFACESPLVTQCEMKLSGKVEPSTSIDTADLQDISYEISTINNTVNFLFSIPSGVTSSVNLIMEQTDSFGTTQLCNKTVSSAGGTIECDFDDTIGESYVTLYVNKDETPIVHKQYAIMEDSPLKFLGNNFFIVFIMLLSVVGMAFSSPEWIIINASVTLLISGSLWLLNGMDFVIGIGAIMWLLVGAIILISKLGKQEDR